MSRVILLTGATGYLGNEILRRYLNAPDEIEIRVLIRGNGAQSRFDNLVSDAPALRARFSERVRPVWGDVQLPQLGLRADDYQRLRASVTDVIHSAASVDFALPLEAARAVNYQGTMHLIDFARACKDLRAFAHISTAHVAGKRAGQILENELEHTAGFANAYEQSKSEAEQFLRGQMPTLPLAVYRTTSLIGDSTGAVRQFNFFHNTLRVLSKGLVPALPGVPTGHIDLIPVDWAARAIWYLVEKNFRAGTMYHLCAEPPRSYDLQGLVDATFDVLTRLTHAPKLRKPKIVPPAIFEMMVHAARVAGNERIGKAMVALNYFLPHLALPKVFDASNARRDLPEDLLPPDIRTYYPKVVESCAQTNWGRTAVKNAS